MPNIRTALVIVDLQPDVMPGGALAVASGDEIIRPINALVTRAAFDVVVATQDWHPQGHISFASTHEGKAPFETISLYGRPQVLWPDHCVQGSGGAELHSSLDDKALDAVFKKGSNPAVDSYSAFRNNFDPGGNRPSTGLQTTCGTSR